MGSKQLLAWIHSLMNRISKISDNIVWLHIFWSFLLHRTDQIGLIEYLLENGQGKTSVTMYYSLQTIPPKGVCIQFMRLFSFGLWVIRTRIVTPFYLLQLIWHRKLSFLSKKFMQNNIGTIIPGMIVHIFFHTRRNPLKTLKYVVR